MSSIPEHQSTVTNRGRLGDATLAAASAAGMLLIEHTVLWRPPFRLSRPASYAVGTATLGTAFSAWVLRHPQAPAAQAVLAWWGIALSGGAMVVTAYYVRHIVEQIDQLGLTAGMVAGGPHNGNHRPAAKGH